jgi:hypothetical protein
MAATQRYLDIMRSIKLSDLRLDPSGVAFATTCCFCSRNKPNYINRWIDEGRIFAAITRKGIEDYRYIYRMEHQTEDKFILEALWLQDAVSFVDASFLEIIERLGRDANLIPTIARLVSIIDNLHTRLAQIEDGQELVAIKDDIALLQTIADGLKPNL